MKSMFLIQYLDICSAYFMTKKPEILFSSFFLVLLVDLCTMVLY